MPIDGIHLQDGVVDNDTCHHDKSRHRHQVYRQPQQIQDNQHHKNIQHHLGEDDKWLNQTLKLRCQYKEQQQDGYQQDPNHLQDGGHRKCILVTNNENNICEEVTYERNKRVIQGYTTPKGEEVEGLRDNNLRYYRTTLLSRDKSEKNNTLLAIFLRFLRIAWLFWN